MEEWNRVPCERRTILVIEPHPDDGVLSMGGIISKYCERGAHAVSIVVFSETDDNKKRIRKKESDTVWRQKLSGEVCYLDLPDEKFHKIVDGKLKIDNLTKSICSQCISFLESKIKEINPDVIYFPIGIGEHFHHMMVNMCFDMIFIKYGNLQYYFYEDYPYADFSRVTYVKHVYRLWEKYDIQEEYHLIDGYIKTKAMLISKYESQLTQEFADFDRKINEYGLAIGHEGLLKGYQLQSGKPYERIWRVNGKKKHEKN